MELFRGRRPLPSLRGDPSARPTGAGRRLGAGPLDPGAQPPAKLSTLPPLQECCGGGGGQRTGKVPTQRSHHHVPPKAAVEPRADKTAPPRNTRPVRDSNRAPPDPSEALRRGYEERQDRPDLGPRSRLEPASAARASSNAPPPERRSGYTSRVNATAPRAHGRAQVCLGAGQAQSAQTLSQARPPRAP